MASFQQNEDRAEAHVSFCNRTSLALLDALKRVGSSDEVLQGLFHCIRACASRSNHWVGDNLHNQETGELYAGNGVFSPCGSRLCATCASKVAIRNRRKLKIALENEKPLRGESYKFITLTIPNPNLSLLQTRAILNKAWTLLQKRKYYKENIRACARGEEFTHSENGYHYHYHLLCIAKFLSFEHFRNAWTECVRKAFKQFNIPFKVKNKDGLLDVFIKELSSLKEAVQKVCNYLTKSDSWEKIPEKDLIEFASIERFPRMFALLGSFRNQRNKKSVRKNKNGSADIILNKQHINDGENAQLNGASDKPKRIKLKKGQRRDNRRKYIEKFGLKAYLKRLEGDRSYAEEYRKEVLRYKYPHASFYTLDGEIF
jgi:hypothetical protein